jgi:hypothetical protein
MARFATARENFDSHVAHPQFVPRYEIVFTPSQISATCLANDAFHIPERCVGCQVGTIFAILLSRDYYD